MSDAYDLVVIGAGPGGYVCAIRAAQLGMKVACVEGRGSLGGTCLNVGCIPSKALLHATELYTEATTEMAHYGVLADNVRIDVPTMMAEKERSVSELTGGIGFLFKKNKVDHVDGWARIDGPGKVTVSLNAGGEQTLETKNIVIATGSEPSSLPGIEIDEDRIVSSTGALSLSEVPKKMVMIGAGVIGLEMGSVWSRLGTEVTVIEYLDHITPGLDAEVTKQFQRSLTKQGMTFQLYTEVTGVEKTDGGLTVTAKSRKDETISTYDADIVLVAVGRKPVTAGLGLDAANVQLDPAGRVLVDDHFQTTVEGIYAIGDVIRGAMLAHKAEEEGVAIAEHLAGQWSHVNYGVIPGVIYTNPEVASVGKTEEELKAEGRAYVKGKFPFTANARAKVNRATEGFVKILSDAETDLVLGVHMIGPNVGEMIGEAVVAMELGASTEDIARSCHAHPTLSEAVKEAALAVDKRPIHI